jgi:hypothetical protein
LDEDQVEDSREVESPGKGGSSSPRPWLVLALLCGSLFAVFAIRDVKTLYGRAEALTKWSCNGELERLSKALQKRRTQGHSDFGDLDSTATAELMTGRFLEGSGDPWCSTAPERLEKNPFRPLAAAPGGMVCLHHGPSVEPGEPSDAELWGRTREALRRLGVTDARTLEVATVDWTEGELLDPGKSVSIEDEIGLILGIDLLLAGVVGVALFALGEWIRQKR